MTVSEAIERLDHTCSSSDEITFERRVMSVDEVANHFEPDDPADQVHIVFMTEANGTVDGTLDRMVRIRERDAQRSKSLAPQTGRRRHVMAK